MRFHAPVFAAILVVGLTLAGCSAARTLDGTWVSDGQTPTTVTVTGDAFKQSASVMGTSFTVTGKGAYDDKALTLTVTEMKLDMPGAPPQLVTAATEKLPKESIINVSWKNNDEIVLSTAGPGQINATGSFKRQKK